MWKAKEHLRFAREVKQEPARRKTRAHTFGSFNCADRSTVLGVQDSRVANGKQLQEVRPAASMPDFFFFFFWSNYKAEAGVVCIDVSNFLLSSALPVLDVIMLMC